MFVLPCSLSASVALLEWRCRASETTTYQPLSRTFQANQEIPWTRAKIDVGCGI